MLTLLEQVVRAEEQAKEELERLREEVIAITERQRA